MTFITASVLLPAGIAVYVQRTRTEWVWKSDIWFGGKALSLKEPLADVIHYVHLGKLAVAQEINGLRFLQCSKHEVSQKRLRHPGAKPGAESGAKAPK